MSDCRLAAEGVRLEAYYVQPVSAAAARPQSTQLARCS
jgi:arylsulfatase A-like enzyme